MSTSYLIALIVALMVPTVASADPARTFTSSDGKTLEAVLLEADKSTVLLRRSNDGKEFQLPVDRLSEKDQAWIQEWIVKNAPAPHPLGWKRLRIHSKSGNLSYNGVTGDSYSSISDTSEVYLPLSSWVHLRDFGPDKTSTALVRFSGESDWRVEVEGDKILVRRNREKEWKPAGVGEGSNPSDPKLLAALVSEGASLTTNPEGLTKSVAAGAEIKALELTAYPLPPDLKLLPKGLQALRLKVPQETLDLNGIEAQRELEYLTIEGGSVTGLARLAELPKLRLLMIKSEVTPNEIPSLGKLSELRHLSLLVQNKGDVPMGSFDNLGQLSKLESIWLGSHHASDKKVNPTVIFRNLPNLTLCNLNVDSVTDKGAFLEGLPNLTEADFKGGLVPSKLTTKLMEAGHFKHLMELDAPGYYPLRNLPQLRRLTMFCHPDAKNFEEIGELPKLRELTLVNASTEHLRQVAKHPSFQNVQKVVLFQHKAGELAPLKDLPSLSFLAILSSDLEQIDLTQLPSLTTFQMSSGRSPSTLKLGNGLETLELFGGSVKSILSSANPSRLKTLRLRHVRTLTGLEALAPAPELECLHLEGCQELESTSGLDQGKSLKIISISQCTKIPDKDSKASESP